VYAQQYKIQSKFTEYFQKLNMQADKGISNPVYVFPPH